jgi:type IV pilus assembly protein PilM
VGLFKAKKTMVGLDLGAEVIKVAQLEESKAGYELVNFGMLRFPPDKDYSSRGENSQEIAHHIRNLLHNTKIKSKMVATSISGYSVIVKQLSLPYPTKKDLMANIQWEAEQHIPFGVQDVTLDVHVVGQNKDNPEYTDVILVAAKNDVVQSTLHTLSLANLMAGVIDLDLFAMENVYEVNYPYQEGCVALIDIGAHQLKINVLRDCVSIFTREVSQAGKLINQKIRSKFGVTAAEAEQSKLAGKPPKDGPVNALRTIFEDYATIWALEIKRAFDFVTSSIRNVQIGKVYLSGGSSLLPGFPNFLQDKLGVAVELLDPFANITVDPDRIDPEYIKAVGPQAAVSIGLALRKVGDS